MMSRFAWRLMLAGLPNLETKRDAARAKLAEIGASSAEAWKDVQKGAQSAWDELDQAFRDASQEF